MTAWWILLLCISLSVIALWKPHYIWGIVCFASWMLLLWFTRTTPLTGFVVGGTGDTILLLTCFGMGSGILLNSVLKERQAKNQGGWFDEGKSDKTINDNDKTYNINVSRNKTNIAMSGTDYYEKLKNLRNPKK